MSVGEKMFGALKTVLTLKEQLDGLGKDLGILKAGFRGWPKRMARCATA